jgi:hypothetical protein
MGALLSVALLLSGVAVPAADPAAHVVWIDMAHTPPLAERVAQEEAARLLNQLGVTVRWRHGAPGDVLDEGEFAVILLSRDRAARPGTFVLGACNSLSTTPRAWVFLSSLQWALSLPSLDSPAEGTRLGTALGRIVAHEIVHALAPSLQHARDGLMAPRLDRTALLQPQMAIDPATRRVVRGLAVAGAVARASLASLSN